jgi:hypothetical protein
MLAQQRAQRASVEAEHTAIRDLIAGNPSLTSDAILGNAALTDDAKHRLLGAIARSTQQEPPTQLSDTTAARLIDRIRRRDDDAERITDIGPIIDAYNAGHLRQAGLDFVTRQFDEAQTPDDAAMAQRKQIYVGSIQPLLNQRAAGVGLSSASQRIDLERYIDSAVQRYRAEGMNPLDLLNPSKPDYLGSPAALLSHVHNVSFKSLDAEEPTNFITSYGADGADYGDTPPFPAGIPPSPLDAWQREFIRAHLDLYRRAQGFVDYLMGVFNKPTDDKDPHKKQKEPDEPTPRTEGPTPDPNSGPSAPPPWRQYELKHGSRQTRVTIEHEGELRNFRLDYPVDEDGIVDLKDYNWEKSAYNKPFVRIMSLTILKHRLIITLKFIQRSLSDFRKSHQLG